MHESNPDYQIKTMQMGDNSYNFVLFQIKQKSQISTGKRFER